MRKERKKRRELNTSNLKLDIVLSVYTTRFLGRFAPIFYFNF